jgi:hypothetical protein
MGRFSLTACISCMAGMLFITAGISPAQFYNKGQDPGYLKWEQIRSANFRVIYPREFGSEAQRMAHILESYYDANSAYLDHRPKSIPVVLHNHSVLSNGFVAWAPRRMELVTTPHSRGYSQDHLEQLALHEFRHVVQVDKLRQGVGKGLTCLLGEAGTGAVAGFMPFWYIEGDATDAETRLSHSGRGRLPSFEMEIKAILADNQGAWSYEKMFFGSFRDFVPSHYHYGYQVVSHARNKYGHELWGKVLDYIARKPYTLYPTYFSLKKYTGLSKTDLYTEALDTLRDHWTLRAKQRRHTEFTRINTTVKKHFTSYRYPRYLNNSVIFAEKSGIDQLPEFILIDQSGREKRIHRPGFYDAANISVAAGKIAWEEVVKDPRWNRRSYSVIKIYDLSLGRERILRGRTRYFAPDLSPEGNFIAAVEADEQNRYYLVILHANTGEVIMKVAPPGNEYLQYPAWREGNRGVIMTSLGGEGKRIVYYDIDSGEWSTVFEAGFEDISELDSRGNYLVFRGGFSGIDNIYAINLENNQCQRVTSSRLGAFTPSLSANADTLLYADYTSQGFDIVKMAFEPSAFTPLEAVRDHTEQLNRPSAQEESRVAVTGRPAEPYEIRKFRKSANLFNFHSWAPLYADLDEPSIENLEVSPGLMLVSQNLLSTATTVLGYEYNLQERDHFLHASFTWSGWYPVFKLSWDYGGFPMVGPPPDSTRMLSTVRTDMSLKTKVSLPLNLTYTRNVMGLQPSVEASYSRAYFYYTEGDEYRSGLTFMDYRLFFYSYLKQSGRDILPRLGGTLDMRYVNTPFEKEQLGSQRSVSAVFYLPGPLRHQTLKVSVGDQKQEPAKFLMGNLLSMPRGIFNQTATALRKYTFDYVFPIAYPDWQIWHAAYFKRFRGSLFYDYARGKDVYIRGSSDGPVNRDFQSLGIELTTDMHLAQIFVPFNIGGRLVWVPETGTTSGEFIFSVDLSQF